VLLRHGEGGKDHLTRLAALSLGAYAVGKKTWQPLRWA
jgi:hypothetical protein